MKCDTFDPRVTHWILGASCIASFILPIKCNYSKMFLEDIVNMFVSPIFIPNNYINPHYVDLWLLNSVFTIVTWNIGYSMQCTATVAIYCELFPQLQMNYYSFGIYGNKRVIVLYVFKLFYMIREHKSYHYPLLYNP